MRLYVLTQYLANLTEQINTEKAIFFCEKFVPDPVLTTLCTLGLKFVELSVRFL